MTTYKLKNPININGQTVKEIDFDFDALTGKDFSLAESRCANGGEFKVMESDYSYQLYLAYFAAVRASNGLISIEDMERLKGTDVREVYRMGRDFLIGQGDLEAPTSDDAGDNSPEPTTQITLDS